MPRATILFLTDICPWPADCGGAQRAARLILELRREYDVVVLGVHCGTPCRPPDDAGVDYISVTDPAVRGFSIADWWGPARERVRGLLGHRLPLAARGWEAPILNDALQQLRGSGRFHAVWACRVWSAEAARAAGFTRIVVDVDDLPGQVLGRLVAQQGWYRSRWLHQAELWKTRLYEQRLTSRFGVVTVSKADDAPRVGAPKGHVVVVPNGVDQFPACAYGHEDRTRLLFVGQLGYSPNSDAVRYFAREVLPLVKREWPGATLVVAGRNAPEDLKRLPGVELLGFVEDLSPLFDAAAACVAPLRLGSGTKLKVLESVARGRATVCTPVAAEGIDLRPGIDALVADGAQAFADACQAMMRDADLRERVGRAGRQRVTERYRWDRVGHAARNAVARVCAVPR